MKRKVLDNGGRSKKASARQGKRVRDDLHLLFCRTSRYLQIDWPASCNTRQQLFCASHTWQSSCQCGREPVDQVATLGCLSCVSSDLAYGDDSDFFKSPIHLLSSPDSYHEPMSQTLSRPHKYIHTIYTIGQMRKWLSVQTKEGSCI